MHWLLITYTDTPNTLTYSDTDLILDTDILDQVL